MGHHVSGIDSPQPLSFTARCEQVNPDNHNNHTLIGNLVLNGKNDSVTVFGQDGFIPHNIDPVFFIHIIDGQAKHGHDSLLGLMRDADTIKIFTKFLCIFLSEECISMVPLDNLCISRFTLQLLR
jgi:hypothetical protein